MDLNDILRNATVITLLKRSERADAFARGYEEATGRKARFFHGFDGSLLPIPSGWKSSPGAFGCCLAHVSTWARALSDYGLGEDDPVAIFEDDCVFCPDFADKLARAARLVPNDWDLFYFGGEHLTNLGGVPVVVAEDGDVQVVRAKNVNRLHAYVAKPRALRVLFERLLKYLTDAPLRTGPCGNETCFDFEVGRVCMSGELTVYAAKPWLCGQGAFVSDTFPQTEPSTERYWQI